MGNFCAIIDQRLYSMSRSEMVCKKPGGYFDTSRRSKQVCTKHRKNKSTWTAIMKRCAFIIVF